MGLIVSTLRNCCLGREAPNRYEEELWTAQGQHSPLGKDREKNENCVEDTESKKINLDYSCLQYEASDFTAHGHLLYDELSTPIRYYILRHQL